MEPFTFKENILIRSVVSILFGLAAGVVCVAAFIKIFAADGSPVFLLPALLAALVAVSLFWFFGISFNNRQIVTVTSDSISSRSRTHGLLIVYWHNLARVSETPLVIDKMRGIMPLVEIMLSFYFMVPALGGNERRSLLSFEGKDGTRISLREHLVYPHRLDQLRQAAVLYAPLTSRSQLILKTNTQN